MAEGKERITDGGKKTKQVMVRFPRHTVERIDDYAGYTHSSRPDFVIDSIREYIMHISGKAVSVITEIEGVDVSKQAKDVFFIERMAELMFTETESYRNAKEGSPRTQDISVLISIPMGLNDLIQKMVDYSGLFTSNQELIKTSVHWMFENMNDLNNKVDSLIEFGRSGDQNNSLENELERLRSELNDKN